MLLPRNCLGDWRGGGACTLGQGGEGCSGSGMLDAEYG